MYLDEVLDTKTIFIPFKMRRYFLLKNADEDKVHCVKTETCHIRIIYDGTSLILLSGKWCQNLIYNNNTIKDRTILTGI